MRSPLRRGAHGRGVAAIAAGTAPPLACVDRRTAVQVAERNLCSQRRAPHAARGQGTRPSSLDAMPAPACGLRSMLRFAPTTLPTRSLGRGATPPITLPVGWPPSRGLGHERVMAPPGARPIGLGANAPARTACSLALVPTRYAAWLPYVSGWQSTTARLRLACHARRA